MKRRLLALYLVATPVFLLDPGRAAAGSSRWVEGEVIVTCRGSAGPTAAVQVATRHRLIVARQFGWLSQRHGKVCGLLRSPARSTAALLDQLAGDPAVETVEPNYLRQVADLPPPDDPLFGSLWALRNTGQAVNGTTGTVAADVRYLAARSMTRWSPEQVVVAVIDTGIDPLHPDLAGSLWTNPDEIPDNQLDDDANGRVDDAHGCNFTDGAPDITDSGYHGTHLSGMVAASANNGLGLAGIAPGTRIMVLKVSADGQWIADAAWIDALEYVVMMRGRGVNIVAVNAAFNGPNPSLAAREAIEAAGAADIVVCASAGNQGDNTDLVPSYPAGYRLPNMLVAAATDQQDNLATFSNYGAASVDLGAPGVNIISTIPTWLPTAVRRGEVSYGAAGIRYAGFTTGITAEVVDCGLGGPGEFPPATAGRIALMARGSLTFTAKVTNAMNAGAIAVVISNNNGGSFDDWTLGQPGNWLPAVGISLADGQALRAGLPAAARLIHSPNPARLYQTENGTSMATAQVAGAVAFAALNHPTESAVQRVARIQAGTVPVPALAGKTVTGGRLNLVRVVDPDGNSLPDWWELDHFGAVGSNPAGDPDGDGVSNFDEFRAGTDPHDALSRFAVHRGGISAGTGAFGTEFAGVAGRFYQLERSFSLAPAEWVPVGPPLAGSGQLMEAIDPAAPAAGGSAFYRVRIVPGW